MRRLTTALALALSVVFVAAACDTPPTKAPPRRSVTSPKPPTTVTPPPTTSPTTPTTPPPTTLPPGASVHQPPLSIDRTGAKDVTAALQTFLNGVPNGATVLFHKNAQYRIEGTLLLTNRKGLTLDGNGARFFATQPTELRGRSQWDLRDMTDTIIQNMVIRGANPKAGTGDDAWVVELEAQHGINIVGGARVTVRWNTISDTFGDFIYISSNAKGGVPKDITVHDNFMRRSGRSGISTTNADGVVLRNNDLAEMRRSGFNLETNLAHEVARNVTIRNNRVGPSRLNFVSGHGHGRVDDLVVIDNVLIGQPLTVTLHATSAGGRRTNVLIARNVSDKPYGASIGASVRIVGYDGVTVKDNVQPLNINQPMHLVMVRDSCKVVVTGNVIKPTAASRQFFVHPDSKYVCP